MKTPGGISVPNGDKSPERFSKQTEEIYRKGSNPRKMKSKERIEIFEGEVSRTGNEFGRLNEELTGSNLLKDARQKFKVVSQHGKQLRGLMRV